MATIVVTGGLGRSGKWIVNRLANEGHEVTAIDRSHPGWDATPRENIDFRVADLTDYGEVTDIFQIVDPDTVVQWGAIPNPERHAGSTVFHNNVTATYNVLANAGECDADVINASSESVYGTAFAAEAWLPDYFPVDEEHEQRPEDSYGTSKVVAEEIADMAVRKYGISVVSIRPSWIQFPGEYVVLDNRKCPADGTANFWSYVDVRDVVSLVATAVSTKIDGHEPVLCFSKDNYMDQSTIDLIAEHFGTIPDQCDLEGDESAFTTAKAQNLFGWEPAHSWRKAAAETVPTPDLLTK